MTQPAFAVVCDNCLESSGDWRAVGELWICGTCWDPLGTLATGHEVLGISPSQGKIGGTKTAPAVLPTPLLRGLTPERRG